MHVAMINEKRGHEFEEEQGEAYGRACREERKWGKGCDYIIISKIKGKKGVRVGNHFHYDKINKHL